MVSCIEYYYERAYLKPPNKLSLNIIFLTSWSEITIL